MASYTIEDVELIRRKSGITYQEAVSLLDYHNGNVARALVDLERNGRIHPQSAREAKAEAAGTAPNAQSTSTTAQSSGKNGFTELISKLYAARIRIVKDDVIVLNISALFSILGVIFAAHLVIIGAIVSLVLGYKFSFIRSDPAFESEKLERMVRTAADNVRSSVNDFAKGFNEGKETQHTASVQSAAKPDPAPQRSYYASRPASYRPDVPTINVPVQVESQDGSVTVQGDSEGYTSATID